MFRMSPCLAVADCALYSQLNSMSLSIASVIIAFYHGWELTLVLVGFVPVIGIAVGVLLVRLTAVIASAALGT